MSATKNKMHQRSFYLSAFGGPDPLLPDPLVQSPVEAVVVDVVLVVAVVVVATPVNDFRRMPRSVAALGLKINFYRSVLLGMTLLTTTELL